ncbi:MULTISPECIES: hybrid sensor histidine kinase/response regulator transcription factor [unclassified Sphingobacterium]|uniref:hybrid sensor histidine kinase/response regulator transcription factor n=1 Tax=unclassified Sphingobacterium TaxID=2609468 RepID=UPI0025D112DD|nr:MULTISPECIES: hybrid sensor histidine kinase/response regulator transcription factor [unclassified Sphingobacterium]
MTTFISMEMTKKVFAHILVIWGMLSGVGVTLCTAQNPIQFNHLHQKKGLYRTPILTIVQDRNGFMWIGGGSQLYKYDAVKFESYVGGNYLKGNPYITALAVDSNNNIIIGTGTGLFIYNQEVGKFYPQTQNLTSTNITTIRVLHNSDILIGTDKGLNLISIHQKDTLCRQFLKGQHIKAITQDHRTKNVLISSIDAVYEFDTRWKSHMLAAVVQKVYKEHKDYITSMLIDNGHIWFGTFDSGVILYNKKDQSFKEWNEKNSILTSNRIRKLIYDDDGQLLIGTLKGLTALHVQSQQLKTYKHQIDNPSSLSQNSIYDIYRDRQQIMWVGTYYGGINLIYPSKNPFYIYKPMGMTHSISSNIISSLAEDEDGYWVGTEEEGLNFISKSDGSIKTINKELSSNLVKDVFLHNDRIYIGTYNGGFNILNKKTGHVDIFLLDEKRRVNFINNVYAICKDSRDNLWIGTNAGFYLYDESNRKISKTYPEIEKLFVTNILETAHQDLLVSSTSGLYIKRASQDHFSLVEGTKDISIKSLSVEENIAWCASNTGKIIRYDIAKKSISFVPVKNVSTFLSVIKAGNNLWITTQKGLISYNLKTKEEHLLTITDGLPSDEFNENSYLISKDRELFFGTLNGLVRFDPSKIIYNSKKQKVFFTNLRLFNNPVYIGDKTQLLNKEISQIRHLDFRYDQNVFALDFALLNFDRSEKNHFAYKIKELDPDWIYTDIPTATYMNLSPGSYTLLIKGANNDGIWSDVSFLSVTIHPPFWKTWWAYLLYFLILVAIIYFLNRFLIERALLIKSEKDQYAKINFFSYISHEIRTPLTLIIHPLKQLLKSSAVSQDVQHKLLGIEKNTNRLLSLINELLDFRKIEENTLQLNVYNYGLQTFLVEISNVFTELAQEKDLLFTTQMDNMETDVYFDRIQFEKVIYNLISNAIKYSNIGGEVAIALTQDQKEVEINISNTGLPIPEDSLDKIFEQYFRTTDSQINYDGTGIGLALSRHIVQLHGGHIQVHQQQEVNSYQAKIIFTIKLQKGTEHFEKQNNVNILHKDKIFAVVPFESHNRNPVEEHSNLSILIIEDNPELSNLLVDMLSGLYRVYVSYNGLDGAAKAEEEIPDLILSDIMMPGLSGLDLCSKLKSEPKTSHIPIILLTALGSIDKQIKGLEQGADAYITKPFDRDYVLLTIRNLLTLAEKNRKSFSLDKFIEKRSKNKQQEDELLSKAIKIIIDNLPNENLSVEFLCRELGMSQPVLHKKLKAITNLSLINFIKSVRMNQAAKMLKTGLYSITEVAYEVGFSDRKYFSKEFKKHFGSNPSDYTKEGDSNPS